MHGENGTWKLVQDDSCHWYVIPAFKYGEWQQLMENTEDGDVPDWARALGGSPERMTFGGTWTVD